MSETARWSRDMNVTLFRKPISVNILRISPEGDKHRLYSELKEGVLPYFLTPFAFVDSEPTFTLDEIGLWLCCSVKHSTQMEKKKNQERQEEIMY